MTSLNRVELISHSPDDTYKYGTLFGLFLRPPAILCCFGDLGGGKTTFVKGVVHALSGIDPLEVLSPTFTYMQIYHGKCPIYHFDLYRLSTSGDFLSQGFDEQLNDPLGISCVEWSERIVDILPPSYWKVSFISLNSSDRLIAFEWIDQHPGVTM